MAKHFLVKKFINEKQTKELSLKLFECLKNNEFHIDPQCPKSNSFYNLKDFLDLLEKARKLIENKTNTSLDSTFSYARIYKRGETLSKHTDRNACEYAATITLDYSGENPWGFNYIDKKAESIVINKGDMFVYDGVNMPHWRDKLEEEWQTQLFLFFSEKEKEKRLLEEKFNDTLYQLYLKSKKRQCKK